ncbi:hypothetical protein CLG96_16635 [Sphingomonas oleivorans]|uniref:Uncharacterized protein n=1 Tax=Sphingomonas oleivorans TaxID=1735121 RepID=A0A2T5FU13_9SPHN|nr:hypothetical protein [Sphingomonas oleivorans]PTQ07777.1 hypothetical protein CLG96_16635 [Sphingomonas oleivorans]
MGIQFAMMACGLGMISGLAIFVLSLIYVVVVCLDLLSLGSPDQSIGEPWFSVLELLIIAVTPAMVALMATVHAWVPMRTKMLSLTSLIFMSMTATLTCSVHFSTLILSRTPQFRDEPWAPLLLSFQWPSLGYAGVFPIIAAY